MAKVTRTVRHNLSETDERRMKVAAAKRGVPVPQYVGDAIRAALAGRGAK